MDNNDRISRLLLYYAPVFRNEYALEENLLKIATEFLEALPQCIVTRQAYATKSGVSDLIVGYQSKAVYIELKAIDGEPTAAQRLFIEKARKANCAAGVCRSLSDIWATLCRSADSSED